MITPLGACPQPVISPLGACPHPTHPPPSHTQAPVGTPADKLRLALVWLLTCEAVPPEGECQQVEALLATVGADMAAWHYVKRMRRLNLTGKQQPGSASVGEGLSGFGGAAQSQLTNLLGTTFGQGLSSLTKGACLLCGRLGGGWLWVRAGGLGWGRSRVEQMRGDMAGREGDLTVARCRVSGCRAAYLAPPLPPSLPHPSSHYSLLHPPGVKNLLAGEQQAAVTVAVEALMDGRPAPDTDAYALFDPKVGGGEAGRVCRQQMEVAAARWLLPCRSPILAGVVGPTGQSLT